MNFVQRALFRARRFLAEDLPSWVGRVALLTCVYVVLMAAIAYLVPAWKDWDWQFFSWLSTRSEPRYSRQFPIVDITPWDPRRSAVPSNRLRVADFLNGLVQSINHDPQHRHPDAIILDILFGPCPNTPCTAAQRGARATLIASIRTAVGTGFFPVYGAEEFPVSTSTDLPLADVYPEDRRIYGVVSASADTIFIPTERSKTDLYYRDCYSDVPFVSNDIEADEDIWSMVDRVLVLRDPANTKHLTCATTENAVRLGPTAPLVYRFTNARTFQSYAALEGKDVIVGSIERDTSTRTDRSGPEVLGWALSDAQTQGGTGLYYDLDPQGPWLFLLIPLFSGIAVLIYTNSFLLLKRTRLRTLRPLLPWLSLGPAVVAGLGALMLFEWWMFSSHHIQPQVSLIAIGVVLASGLSVTRGHQVLTDEANAFVPLPVEAYDYDVFLSYAREDGAWVYEHVYLPFHRAKLPDGKSLSVFFDQSAIRGGSGWQAKISFSLDASRFVVPVYSTTYFKKPYCLFEIMRAHRKWIAAGIGSRCVFPVMLGHPKIYEPVDDIQGRSVDDNPHLVQEYIDEIVERLSHQPSPAKPERGDASP